MSDGRSRPPLAPPPSGAAAAGSRAIPVIVLQASARASAAPAMATGGESPEPSIDGMDGGAVAVGGSSSMGATADTTQRRVATPLKRVASRVPVKDVTDQPLLSQAKQLLEDQRTKWVLGGRPCPRLRVLRLPTASV